LKTPVANYDICELISN